MNSQTKKCLTKTYLAEKPFTSWLITLFLEAVLQHEKLFAQSTQLFWIGFELVSKFLRYIAEVSYTLF